MKIGLNGIMAAWLLCHLGACRNGDDALTRDTATNLTMATATVSATATGAATGKTSTSASSTTGWTTGSTTAENKPPSGTTSMGWTTGTVAVPTTGSGGAIATSFARSTSTGPAVYTTTAWSTRIQTGFMTATASATSAGRSSVRFDRGRATGTMTGWGWVDLGAEDSLTSPTCDGGTPITAAWPCRTATTWSGSGALCMSGHIPALPVVPTASDYEANWGVQVGVNATTDEPPEPMATFFSSLAFKYSGTPSSGLRAVVHLRGDPASVTYCYDAIRSGQSMSVTKFNTSCWDEKGKWLSVADTARIDRISLKVTSTWGAIEIRDLCLEGIDFFSLSDASPTTSTSLRTATLTTTSLQTKTAGTTTATDVVTFVSGRGLGAMAGAGWVNLGAQDILTSPTGLDGQPITSDRVGQGEFNWSSNDALCISGLIPALPASPVQSDYDANWGIQVGVHAGVDATLDNPTGAIGRTFSSLALSFSGTPTAGVRAIVHRKGDPRDTVYCFDGIRSDQVIDLSKFNTYCWDNLGRSLTPTDSDNIDRIGLQVSSTASAIVVSDLCLTAIRFR